MIPLSTVGIKLCVRRSYCRCYCSCPLVRCEDIVGKARASILVALYRMILYEYHIPTAVSGILLVWSKYRVDATR